MASPVSEKISEGHGAKWTVWSANYDGYTLVNYVDWATIHGIYCLTNSQLPKYDAPRVNRKSPQTLISSPIHQKGIKIRHLHQLGMQ